MNQSDVNPLDPSSPQVPTDQKDTSKVPNGDRDDYEGGAFSGNRDREQGEIPSNGRPPGQAGTPGDPRPS